MMHTLLHMPNNPDHERREDDPAQEDHEQRKRVFFALTENMCTFFGESRDVAVERVQQLNLGTVHELLDYYEGEGGKNSLLLRESLSIGETVIATDAHAQTVTPHTVENMPAITFIPHLFRIRNRLRRKFRKKE